MRRRTRGRRRRQLWLPAYGNGGSFSEGETSGRAIGGTMVLTNAGTEDGGIDWLASPVTFDTQIDPEDAQSVAIGATPIGLRDLVAGSEWSLRRVVGKVFCAVTDTGENTGKFAGIEVGAGLIVCNTDEEGGPLTDFNEVNPLTQQAAEDPWIWLRHWVLSTITPAQPIWQNSTGGSYEPNPADFGAVMPHSNMEYGSVMDGPHVDQKTARRIRRDQRLFFVMATRPASMANDDADWTTEPITVWCRFMLRLLGNISGTAGNRGNAAR